MSKNHEMSEWSVPIAVEDRFLVFAFGSGSLIAPDVADAEHLGKMVRAIPNVNPVFDLRGLEGFYSDISRFIHFVGGPNSYVLLGQDEIDAGWEGKLKQNGLVPVSASGQAFSTYQLGKDSFDAEAKYYREKYGYDQESELIYKTQFNDFHNLIKTVHHHSLLVELAMTTEKDSIQVVPYHSHAVHEVETSSGAVVVGRPAVIARTTRAILSDELEEFQFIINNSGTREHHIQKFLESHPNFLRGINYENIYPQLVLERDDGSSLKPDFILEPYDDEFCDILDVKLPTQKLFVGRKDRVSLAAGLHQVAAQLREYANYFENKKYRKFVQEKYGLRVYRPRLIALVGHNMREMSNEQFRRAMTVYDNLQFMTFDQLVMHAKCRMLL